MPAEGRSLASASVLVPGNPQAAWNPIIRALTDSSFRSSGGDYYGGLMNFRSLTEGRQLHLALIGQGSDSTRVVITGRRYAGTTDRPGVISAADSVWPHVRMRDPEAVLLDRAAERIRLAFGSAGTSAPPSRTRMVADVAMSADSILRDLPGGRKGFCRANNVRRDRLLTVDKVNLPDWCPVPPSEGVNTLVLQDPATIPVGTTVEVCAFSREPGGFEIVEWFTDPARCPFDPGWEWPREPNMMRLRRVS